MPFYMHHFFIINSAEESKKHGAVLETEIARRDDMICKAQADLQSTQAEVSAKAEEIEKMETSIRHLKVELSNSERDHRQAQTQVRIPVLNLFPL